jgi:hypothetical protein
MVRIIKAIVIRVVTDICLEHDLGMLADGGQSAIDKEDEEEKPALIKPVRLGRWLGRTVT